MATGARGIQTQNADGSWTDVGASAPLPVTILGIDGGVAALGDVLTTDGRFTGWTIWGTVASNAEGAGGLLYLKSDGEWASADADAEATTAGMLAVATASGTGSKQLLLQGQICKTAWDWTVGAMLYAGTGAATFQEAAPTGANDVVRVAGYAVSADTIYFAPQAAYTVVSA
jgi:hypothetical protein